MHVLMNRYLNKITPAGLLRSPPNEGSMGGSGTENQGAGKESGQEGGNEGNQGGDEEGDDDDALSKLLADDDDSDSISLDDEDSNSYELTDEQKAAGDALRDQILGGIDGFAFDESDIPEDFDPSDRGSLAKLLSTQHQKAMKTTLAMVPSIINHALGITAAQLEKKLASTVGHKSKESEATRVFQDMGYGKEDLGVAKTIFKKALSQKMSPKDAAKATKRAMSALGKTGKTSNNSGMTRKEGKDALEGFF